MAKKELFKSIVECLQKGNMTLSEMSFYNGRPVQHCEREIKRIKQCGPFSQWIIYFPKAQAYSFKLQIKNMPIESIIFMIKYFYKQNKNFDTNMDLQRSKIDRKEFPQTDLVAEFDKYIMEAQ